MTIRASGGNRGKVASTQNVGQNLTLSSFFCSLSLWLILVILLSFSAHILFSNIKMEIITFWNLFIYLLAWNRKWKSTPVFLPRKFHGPRSLVGYSPWGWRVREDWSDLVPMNVYNWITLLYSRKSHSIVNQLYYKKIKFKQKTTKAKTNEITLGNLKKTQAAPTFGLLQHLHRKYTKGSGGSRRNKPNI